MSLDEDAIKDVLEDEATALAVLDDDEVVVVGLALPSILDRF